MQRWHGGEVGAPAAVVHGFGFQALIEDDSSTVKYRTKVQTLFVELRGVVFEKGHSVLLTRPSAVLIAVGVVAVVLASAVMMG